MEMTMTAITDRFKTDQAKRNAERKQPMPSDYRPYDQFPEFNQGIDDYMNGVYENPYTDPRDGVKAQAHDRGSEYAMRVLRYNNS
jgi:hypothetical protein